VEEYAKEVAIDFDYWKNSNYEPIEVGNYQGLFRPRFSGVDINNLYTRHELYDLYIKNKKP